MLMAGIYVQMTAVRYKNDINIASLFPAPTPLSHPPLACVCSTQTADYHMVLHSLREGYEFSEV